MPRNTKRSRNACPEWAQRNDAGEAKDPVFAREHTSFEVIGSANRGANSLSVSPLVSYIHLRLVDCRW